MKPSHHSVSTSAGDAAADRTLRCRLVANGAGRSQTHLGNLPPVDIHEALGIVESADGLKSSRLLLATLGSCLLERIRANATIGNIDVQKLVLEVEAELAISPLWDNSHQEPRPVGFESIQVKVHMDADAPEAALQTLIQHAMIWSPVANTLHAPIHLDVTLVPKVV